MKLGKKPRSGDVVLAYIQFADSFDIKKRPAAILFEEHGNFVVAGVTSNTDMEGISITKEEGAFKNSVIKLNYIFTVSEKMIEKTLFHLSSEKKQLLLDSLSQKLKALTT